MLAQGNFNFHARVSVVTQHFFDAPHRQCALTGLLQNFSHDDLPRQDVRFCASGFTQTFAIGDRSG